VLHVLKNLIVRLKENRVFDIAAQLSYYILLSFFPFLLLAVTLIGYLPYNSESLLTVLRPVIPTNAYHLIESNLVVMVVCYLLVSFIQYTLRH
jgi:membrane protein